MIPYGYSKPQTLADAVGARERADVFVLAGGTDLIAQMKAGAKSPAHIVDVKNIAEMTGIVRAGDGALEIGAAVSATVVARHLDVQTDHAALHDSAQLIGSLQIQNRATLGGNICNAAPSADAVPALIVDQACVRIIGPNGERESMLEDLFEGPGRTTLGAGELLVSVRLPKPAARSASAYLRFTPRREMDIAVVGAAVRIGLDDRNHISTARIALASVAPTPIRARSAEAALVGNALATDVIRQAGVAAQADASPISDTRASADYRRELVAVLVRRAIEACAARLGVEE